MQFRLRWKILLLTVALPIVLALGSLKLVHDHVSRNVREIVEDALHRSSLVCRNVLEAQASMLDVSAQVIVRDPRFFASLAIPASFEDAEFRTTVRGVARDFSKIADVDIFDVLDPAGRSLASAGHITTTTQDRAALLRALDDDRPVPRLLVAHGALFLASFTPVRAGDRTVGILLLGVAVDDDLAGDLRVMTHNEVTFLAGIGISGTTLRSEGEREDLVAAINENFFLPGKFSEAQVCRLELDSSGYLTLVHPMPWATSAGASAFVLQRALEEEMAYLGEIERGLLGLGLGTLAVALLVGLVVSHRITHRILKLVRGAEEIERGNYEYPLEAEGTDEIAYLTRRFTTMRQHERSYIRNLREVTQLKSRFIDVASHELRTPISVIQGYAELLAQGSLGRVTGKQTHALEVIEQNLQSIVRIAENATWMAQLDGERPIMGREECDVRSILDGAVKCALDDASGRQVTVAIEVHADPSAYVDGPRLVQALCNLVKNGIRFTPDGGSVAVRARREESELVLEVEDTGVGIPSEGCRDLLERSVLVCDVLHHHSSSNLEFDSAGLGLGLPIARGIVEAHGGSMTVTSIEGQGSVFTMRLPGAYPGKRAAA